MKNVTVVTVKMGVLNTFYFFNSNFLSIFINNKNIGNLTVTTVTRYPQTLDFTGFRRVTDDFGNCNKV